MGTSNTMIVIILLKIILLFSLFYSSSSNKITKPDNHIESRVIFNNLISDREKVLKVEEYVKLHNNGNSGLRKFLDTVMQNTSTMSGSKVRKSFHSQTFGPRKPKMKHQDIVRALKKIVAKKVAKKKILKRLNIK